MNTGSFNKNRPKIGARRQTPSATVYLKTKDLPAHCPDNNTELWSAHPKVYVAIESEEGSVWVCPYCSTRFVLRNESDS